MPTTTPLGKVSITPKGEFILGTEYRILDVVYSPAEHAAFLARRENVNVGLEDADTWMKLAQGMDGESAFDAAAAGGYAGTKEEFYQELADFNGYAAQAKESADSAAASKEAAQQAAETAASKAEEMRNTLGTQPEGAGTVWENIGERPEGVTGSLWDNAGNKLDLSPIKNAIVQGGDVTTITTPIQTQIDTIGTEIGSGFDSSNTIAGNIGTRPADKMGTLWENVGVGGGQKLMYPLTVDNVSNVRNITNFNVEENSFIGRDGNLCILNLVVKMGGTSDMAGFMLNLPAGFTPNSIYFNGNFMYREPPYATPNITSNIPISAISNVGAVAVSFKLNTSIYEFGYLTGIYITNDPFPTN